MAFIAQLNIPDITDGKGSKLPLRAYISESWNRLFYDGSQDTKYIQQAVEKLTEVRKSFRPSQFSLAALWADTFEASQYSDGSRRVRGNVDFFLLDDMEPWPGNPEIEIYSIVDGNIETTAKICGQGATVLGKEEEYRVCCCKSLEGYINSSPMVYTCEPEEVFVPRFKLENGVWIPLD